MPPADPPGSDRAGTRRPTAPVPAGRIFLGLGLGAAAGVICNRLAPGAPALAVAQKYASDPIGKIFLNLLVLMVIPLVFSSLSLGVARVGDPKRLGRIGARTIAFFLVVTAIAVGIGLGLATAIRPGDYVPEETKSRLLAAYGGQAADLGRAAAQTGFGVETLVGIVPRNPFAAIAKPNPEMLALVFVAILAGVGLAIVRPDRARPVVALLEGIEEVTGALIGLVMRAAPLGVAALVFSVTSRFGWDLIVALGMYVVTVVAGLLLHQLGVLSILVRVLARADPWAFLRKVRAVVVTAFSTSSSNATLPTTMAVAQGELGIPPAIGGFVLPLGATMNMNGTALFEGVTVLFLAQVFGVHLSVGAQAVVVVMAVLTAVGAAGVPSGSIPLLIVVLQTVGVPAEGIAIVLGVDRILDMCRTVVNVTGDLVCAAYVARAEAGATDAPPRGETR